MFGDFDGFHSPGQINAGHDSNLGDVETHIGSEGFGESQDECAKGSTEHINRDFGRHGLLANIGPRSQHGAAGDARGFASDGEFAGNGCAIVAKDLLRAAAGDGREPVDAEGHDCQIFRCADGPDATDRGQARSLHGGQQQSLFGFRIREGSLEQKLQREEFAGLNRIGWAHDDVCRGTAGGPGNRIAG